MSFGDELDLLSAECAEQLHDLRVRVVARRSGAGTLNADGTRAGADAAAAVVSAMAGPWRDAPTPGGSGAGREREYAVRAAELAAAGIAPEAFGRDGTVQEVDAAGEAVGPALAIVGVERSGGGRELRIRVQG